MRIENFVTRVTVLHHKAWQNFQFTSNIHYGCFSCIPFLRRLSLHTGYFVNFTAKYLNFQSRNIWFGSYFQSWRPKVWQKMTSKLAPWQKTSWHHARESSCMKGFSCPSPGQVHGNSGQVCKKFLPLPDGSGGNDFKAWNAIPCSPLKFKTTYNETRAADCFSFVKILTRKYGNIRRITCQIIKSCFNLIYEKNIKICNVCVLIDWLSWGVTLFCQVDYSILINWTSPFPLLRVFGFLFHFYYIFDSNSCMQRA